MFSFILLHFRSDCVCILEHSVPVKYLKRTNDKFQRWPPPPGLLVPALGKEKAALPHFKS